MGGGCCRSLFYLVSIFVALSSVGLWFAIYRGGNRIHDSSGSVKCAVYGADRSLKVVPVISSPLGDVDVEVRMAFASLNPVDKVLRALWLPCGATDEKPCAIGFDGSGTVSRVGSNVTDWRLGDRVMMTGIFLGTACEVVVVPQDQLVLVPPQLSLRRAAALPIIGRTSLHALQNDCPMTFHTKRVLVAGGGTAIGVIAMQLAREGQAEVIATCGNVSLCRAAGAHHIINYHNESVAQGLARLGIDHVDIVYECSYTPDLYSAVRAMQPCFVTALVVPQQLWRLAWSKWVDDFPFHVILGLKPTLKYVAEIAHELQVLPHFHEFPLTDAGIKEGMDQVGKGGKVIFKLR